MSYERKSGIQELSKEETEQASGGLPAIGFPPKFEVRWQTLTGSISLDEAVSLGYLPG